MDALGPLVAVGGVIGLFSAAAALVLQLFRQNSQLGREREQTIHRLEQDNRDLRADVGTLKAQNQKQEAENWACRIQVNGLCGILRENGLTIPDWLFRGESA